MLLDAVRAVRGPHDRLFIETRVDAHGIHRDSCWGTADCILIDNDARTVRVFDLKWGYGMVEAYDNPQGVSYLIGARDTLLHGERGWSYSFTVVQPRVWHRAGRARTWNPTETQLNLAAERLEDAGAEALGNNPRTISGPWCKFCPARHACPAAQDAAAGIVDMISEAVPRELDAAEMGTELSVLVGAAERLQARITGLQAEAMERIRLGNVIPGWGAESTGGRLDWMRPAPEVIALGEAMGVCLAKPAEPITPTQAKAAGLPVAVLASLSERKPGAIKLVPISTADTRRVFGNQGE